MAYSGKDREQLWFYDTVKEVDDNAWIIGGEALISRHNSKPPQPYWEGDQGSYFTMAQAPSPTPTTRRISDSCPIKDAILKSCKWKGLYRIGNAYLSVSANRGAQEHNTLEALKDSSFNFMVPTEYCHAVYGRLYHIVYSVLPGKSLVEVWPKTKDSDLKRKWTLQIAETYLQLSNWHNDRICGVDGGNLTHHWAVRESRIDPDSHTHEALIKNFKTVGMDCSEFVFAHNRMMPLSFMVDESNELVGIFMWEDAGFVPKDWVRTMTRANAFTESTILLHYHQWADPQDLDDWETLIEDALIEKGFREFWENFVNWRGGRLN